MWIYWLVSILEQSVLIEFLVVGESLIEPVTYAYDVVVGVESVMMGFQLV